MLNKITLTPLTASELYKLGFEEDIKDCWHNSDFTFQLIEQANGFMQYSGYTENTIGISMKTVESLMARYVSITGEKLVYRYLAETLTAHKLN